MPRYILLFGPPGVGKGTQGAKLAKKYGLPLVSTGDLFRDHMRRDTDLGTLAKRYIDVGELVPDEVTARMLQVRLEEPDCKSGAFIDGFPRTLDQAELLKTVLGQLGGIVSGVLHLELAQEKLLTRLTGRRVCSGPEKHVFNVVTNPPLAEGFCDHCGCPLTKRSDDHEETAKRRLQVYLTETAPLLVLYKRTGLLHTVDADGTEEAVTQRLVQVIDPVLSLVAPSL